MMRVLMVSTFFPNSVDPHRTVFMKNLAHAMRALCQLVVVAPVPCAPLPMPGRHRAQRGIAHLEQVEGIDVLHPRFPVLPGLHWLSGLGYFIGVLAMLRRLKREGRPPLIHAHCAYPDGVGVALAARMLGLPYVITAHGSDINVYAEKRLLRPQIRWALRGASGVVAVSGALASKIEQLTAKAPLGPRASIPCAGFDPSVFHPRPLSQARAALALPADARIVVFVGHLVPIKGIGFLVEAWAELMRRGLLQAQDRLVLIGEGTERAALERQVAAAGVHGHVQFTGVLAQREVSGWVSAANLLCLPSMNEGMPNVVVEALASGVPVVATRVGGVPDLVQDKVNGLLVAPAQPAALADAIAQALTHPWDRDAVRRSVEQMTWASLARRNCDFLESIAEESAQ